MKVIHIDDSQIALLAAREAMKKAIPEVQVETFRSSIEFMATPPRDVDLFLIDLNMPQVVGLDVLRWIKRHPHYHSVAAVILSAEQDPIVHLTAKRFGAYEVIVKPIQDAEMKVLMGRVLSSLESRKLTPELVAHFAEELTEITIDLVDSVSSPTMESANHFFRVLHTIKGNAATVQLPLIADFVHGVEGTFVLIQKSGLWGVEHVQTTLQKVCRWLEAQAKKLLSRELHDEIPHEIEEGLQLIRKNIEAGWTLLPSLQLNHEREKGPKVHELTRPQTGLISKNETSVRILNSRLDEVQAQIKRIIQIKNQLNHYFHRLKSEFNDESFPDELGKLVRDLQSVSSQAIEFFILLRVEPIGRLKALAQRTLSQCSEQVGKMVELEFDGDLSLEADLPVLECLEQSLVHLIRNSLDHGIEEGPSRTALNKDPVAKVRLSVEMEKNQKSPDSSEVMILKVSDDGRGIDPTDIRRIALERGLIEPQVLKKFTDSQVIELIFADGFSSKDTVTELSGRGVGMAAVKELVEKLNGSVRLSSQVGVGTECEIRIPRIFRL